MQAKISRPPVLCIGGLDPSGGAGLQADIESIAHCGGHALPVASCLTVQNSIQAESITAIEPTLIERQVNQLLKDMTIASCKIGVIPNSKVAIVISHILTQLPNIPVVYDPVFSPTQGDEFCNTDTVAIIKNNLLPAITVLTPNAYELNILSNNNLSYNHDSLVSQARGLCQMGIEYVLVTGADSPSVDVHNTLVTHSGVVQEYKWPRFPHSYHGSGCTLSSALACYLALGCDIPTAVNRAQQYTWRTLQHAEQIGRGQWIPTRINAQDSGCDN